MVTKINPLTSKSFFDVTSECWNLKKVDQALSTIFKAAISLGLANEKNTCFKGLVSSVNVLKLTSSVPKAAESVKKFIYTIQNRWKGEKTDKDLFFAAYACLSPYGDLIKLGAITNSFWLPGAGVLRVLAPFFLFFEGGRAAYEVVSQLTGENVCRAQQSENSSQIETNTRLLKLMESVAYIAIGILLLIQSAFPLFSGLSGAIIFCSVNALVLSIVGYYYENWGKEKICSKEKVCITVSTQT
jgi:hypothetical protein